MALSIGASIPSGNDRKRDACEHLPWGLFIGEGSAVAVDQMEATAEIADSDTYAVVFSTRCCGRRLYPRSCVLNREVELSISELCMKELGVSVHFLSNKA
jgi:hypothetical protein